MNFDLLCLQNYPWGLLSASQGQNSGHTHKVSFRFGRQAILICRAASERIFLLSPASLICMITFLRQQNNVNGFRNKMASYNLFSDLPLTVRHYKSRFSCAVTILAMQILRRKNRIKNTKHGHKVGENGQNV